MSNNNHDRMSILEVLRLIRSRRFYGTVEIICEDGYPKCVKLHPTYLIAIDRTTDAVLGFTERKEGEP